MKVRRLDHVTIKVRDIDEARHFYGEVLGLPCRTDGPSKGPSGAWFDLGDRQLHMGVGEPQAFGQHFALMLEDFDDAVAALEKDGLEVHRGKGISVHVLDPSGNDIELLPS